MTPLVVAFLATGSDRIASVTAPAADAITPVPAATLMLLRDGAEGVEVLLTTRHSAAGFAAEALVFPGGKVNPEDGRLRRFCAGGTGRDDDSCSYRVAAIRETFEECGVLLGRATGNSSVLSRDALAALLERKGGAPDFATLVERAPLELATDLLVPFAHWITPADQPRRFDTRFFLARAPEDQVAVHDGREAVDAIWITAGAALREAETGHIKLVFATRMNLLKLGRAHSVAAALDAARGDSIVTVEPHLVQTPDGPAFEIPAAAGYGLTQMLVSKMRRA